MSGVVDTTSIWGRGAVQDTYNLIAEAIKQICRALVQGDDEAPQLTEAAELLGKLLLQDVEPTTDGYKIKRGTVKDRIPSVYDPEQRHGRKSPGNTFTGHKAEVAGDSETGVIANVNVNAGNASAGARKAEATDAPGETRGARCCRLVSRSGQHHLTKFSSFAIFALLLNQPNGGWLGGDPTVASQRRFVSSPCGTTSAHGLLFFGVMEVVWACNRQRGSGAGAPVRLRRRWRITLAKEKR